MRNADLLQLFSGYQYQTEAICRKWTAKINEQINVHYPYSPDLWEKCKADEGLKAIMLVGQMPGQWDWCGAPPILERDRYNILERMKDTRYFDRNKYGSSPYFGFITQIEEIVNSLTPEEARLACYWTNVCRCVTADGKKNDAELKDNPAYLNEYLKSVNTLPDEIKMMEPDAIIFGVGAAYKPYLENIFSCTFAPIQLKNIYSQTVFIERIVAEGLPEKTFLTFHPGYIMQWIKKQERDIFINELATLIKA